MSRVKSERPSARGWLAGAAALGLVLGFVACGGSDEHRAAPRHEAAAGDASAGTPGNDSGGSSAQQVGGAPGSSGASGDGSTDNVAGAGQGGGGDAAAAGQSAGGAGTDSPSTGGAGGEATGGAGGEPSTQPVVDPVCGANSVQVGAYSLWCGKVNEHFDAELGWIPDPDCNSGCNVTGVSYCQKFYPTADAIVQLDQTKSVWKDWKNGGFANGDGGACQESVDNGVGISGEYACCAPIP